MIKSFACKFRTCKNQQIPPLRVRDDNFTFVWNRHIFSSLELRTYPWKLWPENLSCYNLPDFAGLFADHGVAFFAAESLGEGVHVGKRAIGAEARQRVRVSVGLQARGFGALIRCPRLAPSRGRSAAPA